MTRIRINPYKLGSKSAKDLATEIGGKRLFPDERSKFVARNGDVIINWGVTKRSVPERIGHSVKVLNENGCQVAANKLKTFQQLKLAGVNIPLFTTSKSEATEMLEHEVCKRIYCRTTLSGHSGEGITVIKDPANLVDATLYVASIPKATEYRIHVFNDEVIDYVEKKAKQGAKDLPNWNPDVRSYENGWIFAREGVEITDEIKQVAIQAVSALGLDFAAVDLCISRKDGKPYILELNTSPALQGTTLERYKEAVLNYAS